MPLDRLLAQTRRLAGLPDEPDLDEDHGSPRRLLAEIRIHGLLSAPLPPAQGGLGLVTDPARSLDLCRLLYAVGHVSLPLGRLYEGHVNALALVCRFGRPEQVERHAADAWAGHLFGVWNTEAGNGLKLVDGRLVGAKTYASGTGFVTRPLVTATLPEGTRLMVVPSLAPGERADLSAWRAHGMRASASGVVDFTGIAAGPDTIIGRAGDYHRQPWFSGGAWRFAAVQAGGIGQVLDIVRRHLRDTGRGGDPHQQARLGQAALATETARLWVERAAAMEHATDPERAVAYVNLARLAVERAGLDVMELAERSIGLAGMMRSHPFERWRRDLATYLRQPAPDQALVGAAAFVLGQEASSAELWDDAR